MRKAALLAIASLALGGGPAAASGFRSDAAGCGTVSVELLGEKHPSAFRITISTGHVVCATAESTLRSYLANSVTRSGWFCVRGHSSQGQSWAAACGRSDGVLVRAFAASHS